MDQPKLLNYIASPAKLNEASLPILSNFVKEFPYCQTGQLLLARNLKNLGHVLAESQLKIAAAYSTDRIRLFELMNSDGVIAQPLEYEVQTDSIYSIDELLQLPDLKVETKENEEVVPAPIMKKSMTSELHEENLADEEQKKIRLLASIDRRLTEAGFIAPEKKEQTSQHDLIDQFISTQPRILNTDDFAQSDADFSEEEETDEFEDFVSETLAVIYTQQGNKTKAIKIYEKLSLKFPEKSSYFAAQIKKLKN